MSLSTLGAQLAALNSASQGGAGGGGAIAALPSSRRHEDAIGRGMHHSVQVGHAVVDRSHIFKASILYPDARQASNVPLTTLQENCRAALEELASSSDPVFGDFAAKLCRNNNGNNNTTERGLLTRAENQEMDAIIQDLLFRLALRMSTTNASGSSDGVDSVVCGLNIIEYLMRQYDLHLRPKLVSTTLLVWLPHHENPYFLRWLQLVDLANLQTYAWLRPHAIPNAKVGRDAIAKAASKNLALCRDLLHLATRASGLPEAGPTLSFTAAVLIEAMTLQQRANGSLDERTCHALLPTIRLACLSSHKKKHSLFTNWGYILASTLVETSCLADEPRKGLVASILQGLGKSGSIMSSKKTRPSSTEEEEDVDMQWEEEEEGESKVDDDVIQNGLIVVMSLLQQQPPLAVDNVHHDQDDDSSKITSQLAVGGGSSTNKKVLFGNPNASCVNDKVVWQALLSLDNLASRFSRLLIEDGFVDVIHFITSLFLVGWKRSEKARLKSGSNKHRHMKLEKDEQFLKDLLQDGNLASNLWSKPEWIEALVCFVLINSAVFEKESPNISDKEDPSPFLGEILQILRPMNATSYDRGITQALLRLKRTPRAKLASYLGLLAEPDDITNTIGNPSEGGPVILLPPRVALEHADVEIRLEAIDRVLAQGQEEADTMGIHGGETIINALTRRLLFDDNVDVATKASKTLCSLMDTKQSSKKSKPTKEVSVSFGSEALEALYRWTEMPQVDHKMKSVLLCQLLHLVALSAAKIKEDETESIKSIGLLVKLVEALGAFLMHGDASVAKEATKGIIAAITGKNGSKTSDNEARKVLMSLDFSFLSQFAREAKDAPHTEQVLRRRFLPSMLKAYTETLSQITSQEDNDRARAAMMYCLWSTNTHGNSFSSSDRKLLLDVLSRTVAQVASTPEQLMSVLTVFLSVEESFFEEVGRPYIVDLCQAITDKSGKSASGIAVVMEVAARPTLTCEMVERLIGIAKSLAKAEPDNSQLGLVPALALLSNPEAPVRNEAFGLISVIQANLENHKNSEWKQLSKLCKFLLDNESLALFGSPSLLSTCLQSTVSISKHSTGIQESFLKLALRAMVPFVSKEEFDFTKLSDIGRLGVEDASGGHFACLTVLTAAQSAGESTFPLLTRWSKVGKPILDFVLENDLEHTPSTSLLSVLDHATLMLKGMKESESSDEASRSSSVIIMSGPGSRGGRKRSYSFGKNEPSNFLSPYSNEMAGYVVSLLQKQKNNMIIRHVRNTIAEKILSSESWANNIFSKLPVSHRSQITAALLDAATDDRSDYAEAAFFALPIPCSDLVKLLDKRSTQESNLSVVTYIADYGSANAKQLVTVPDVVDVFGGLLAKFTLLSMEKMDESEGVEYARTSLLFGLVELFGALPGDAGENLALDKKTKFNDWISALVGVVGANEKSHYRPLESPRSKKLALSVLTCLCALYPAGVTQNLITAVESMAASVTSEKEAGTVIECLLPVVPVYLDYARAANLSASDLIRAFIGASNISMDDVTRGVLYQGFADALSRGTQSGKSDILGSFLSSCVASDVFYSCQAKKRHGSTQLSSQILNHVAVSKRVQAVMTVVSNARDTVLKLGGEDIEESNALISLAALSAMADKGAGKAKSKPKSKSTCSETILRKLAAALMAATCEIISSPAFAKFLRHCKAESSTEVVRLWQDLLLIQSILNSQLGTAGGAMLDFWTSIAEVTNDTLESIQRHLPSHIFLAFATSLVKESDSDDLRSRALQLVADRSLQLDSSDPEACLFLDMFPYLSSLLDSENNRSNSYIVQQSVLIAIEHITRKFCINNDGLSAEHLDTVSKSLSKVAELIENQCQGIDLTKFLSDNVENQSLKLLCTASLCAATAVRACGARALPVLPRLVKPCLLLFGHLNTLLSDSTGGAGNENQTRILQLSLLRLFTAVVETMPQFVGPYLADMFRPSALPSAGLHSHDDEQSVSINTARARLCQIIAEKVPARQLFTPLTNALLKPDTAEGLIILLNIVTMSIGKSKSTELGTKVNSILKAGTSVYDFAADHEERRDLIVVSDRMLMALVLKLSELQLRSIYSNLRTWRGDFDKDDPKKSAFKRYCFWRLSASLATQLRSIFLPCFATVFSDVVEELDSAVLNLCNITGLKVAGGKKKQRVTGDISTQYDNICMASLQAVLKCIEVSLRSDAHEGGSWIRDGESERFDLLLMPLGKLFHCQVESGTTTYCDLVQGQNENEELGSVGECIVALASAAGDEHKWKPLNHIVLQACSHDTRGEVRKAGVRCLLSLIKSIGEEYMVLIPECLPVLSELLEDTDEEIAGSAQECIASSEELLGESLEDSLL